MSQPIPPWNFGSMNCPITELKSLFLFFFLFLNVAKSEPLNSEGILGSFAQPGCNYCCIVAVF